MLVSARMGLGGGRAPVHTILTQASTKELPQAKTTQMLSSTRVPARGVSTAHPNAHGGDTCHLNVFLKLRVRKK